MMRAVRRGDVSDDVGDRAHPVHVGRNRVRGLGVALHDDADRLLLANGALRGHDRARSPERDRQGDAREQHHVAHRHDDRAHPAAGAGTARRRSSRRPPPRGPWRRRQPLRASDFVSVIRRQPFADDRSIAV